MLLGKVKLLPFFVPGDPAMGDAIKGLAGKRSAVLLANHGPVVSGKDLESSVNAIEELEATARLALMLKGANAKALDDSQINAVVNKFNVEWD
jgi:ribulose-5-phosphate 4-epimerase/fuculose-1-phosphate aldolase